MFSCPYGFQYVSTAIGLDYPILYRTRFYFIKSELPCGRFAAYRNSSISEQVALTAMFLLCFILTMCNAHSLRRFTTLFSINHPTLCFYLRTECRQMPSTEQSLHQADKNSHRRCS